MRHARDTRKTARTNTLHGAGVSRNTNGRSQGSQTQSRERNNTWPKARGRSMSGLQTLLKRQCCGLLRFGDLVCLHMSAWIEESIETRLDPPRAAHCLPIPPHLSHLHTALLVSATLLGRLHFACLSNSPPKDLKIHQGLLQSTAAAWVCLHFQSEKNIFAGTRASLPRWVGCRGQRGLLTRPRRLVNHHGLRSLLLDTLQRYAGAVAVPVQHCRRCGASLR